jgi:hypothetical protein
MIRFMRKARVAHGKGSEALQFAREAAYYNKNFKGAPQVKVFVEVAGDYTTIHWQSDYENLAAFEQVVAQTLTDEKYIKMLNDAGSYFVEGSVQDKLILELA